MKWAGLKAIAYKCTQQTMAYNFAKFQSLMLSKLNTRKNMRIPKVIFDQ